MFGKKYECFFKSEMCCFSGHILYLENVNQTESEWISLT